METMSYAFVPSFISTNATISKLRSEECLKLLDVVQTMWSSWKHEDVMEMNQHACTQSFISMRGTVSEFEE